MIRTLLKNFFLKCHCSSAINLQLYKNMSTKVSAINKVLIANRGEIACRVMKTAKRLGIRCVAVYSEADAKSMHVSMADEAHCIGPAPSQESYLCGKKILEVANQVGCEAVHPGYGFLSENAEFADLCKEKEIIFIGPPASAIRDMGIKSTSKAIMSAAGVPIIEGYHGENQSIDRLKKEADKIGYPLMIKAVRGGGGKGMRIALNANEFEAQLESAKRESLKAFGDDAVLLEKYVQQPRHVEVQVFGDKHGNYVHLAERDCSLQRRHQKIIEEAPAPGVSPELRHKLGMAAVAAARAVNYVGAGTVEFILDCNTLNFHFMEMNTRLQVEHPITEMITGTDLVEWQLRVAAGEKLPVTQDQISVNGHAFEGRIYAEDPKNNFMPGAGSLLHLTTPKPAEDVRVETGVRQGDEISVHYDPMIAKLVVWGQDRSQALRKLHSRLAEYNIVGVETNVNFLMELCRNRAFQNGDVHTGFISERNDELFSKKSPPSDLLARAALSLILLKQHETLKKPSLSNDMLFQSTFLADFRVNHASNHKISFTEGDTVYNADVTNTAPNKYKVCINGGKDYDISGHLIEIDGNLIINTTTEGHVEKSNVYFNGSNLHIFTSAGKYEFSVPVPKYFTELSASKGSTFEGSAVSPMPGVVDKVFVKEGDVVAQGDPLLVVIAMKMEHVIKAPKSGTIAKVIFNTGVNVQKNATLIKFTDE